MMRKAIQYLLLPISLLVVLLMGNAGASAVTAATLASGPPLVDPAGIAISPDDTTLYITDYSANVVFTLPAAGGTPTALTPAGPPFENTRGIAVSPDGTKLFVAAMQANSVLSLPATGGTPTILHSGSPFVTPHAIAVSADGSTLFVADAYAPAVFSLPAAGGTPTTLASGPPFGIEHAGPMDVAVSVDGSTLFVTAGYSGIFSLPATGGTPTLLASGPPLVLPAHLALSNDGTTLFVLDADEHWTAAPTPAIYTLTVTGGTPTLFFSGPPLAAAGMITLSNDGSRLFGADTGYQDRYYTGPPGELGRVYTINLAAPVGGVAQLPEASDSSGRNYIPLAALAAATLVALTASGWYARRRWLS